MTTDTVPSLLSVIILLLILVVSMDIIMLRGRIGGFQNVFVERAERIAWRVWDRTHKEG